ncbi:MAG: nuclear transport factor 2 family protein [Pseudomonadota bacterium]
MTQEPIRTALTPEDANLPDPAEVDSWVAAYFAGTRGGDAARWASAFATGEAILDDPVGTPLTDTHEAILQMGEGFLAAFKTVGLHDSFVHVVGLEAVAKWQGRGTTRDGQRVTFEGIDHFTFNADGKITELRGFFAPPGS